jgi:phage terminase large subunit-like protein
VLLNCSRQSGKSTVAASLAVYEALALPGALVLLLSPSLRQSQELFRKTLDVQTSSEPPLHIAAISLSFGAANDR